MSIRVPASGSLNARLVLYGEAPAKWECRTGKPFVGPSGHTLDRWWASVGLRRSHFYIDNVFPYRAPKDTITKADHDEVEEWAATIHTRLAKLTDPWLVVPTGNIALRALMRRPLWRQDSPKIGEWRGSIMQLELDDGRIVKMIPTIHPAATFRQPRLAKLCKADWKRIAEEAHTREINLPVRVHLIPPIKREWVRRYIARAQASDALLAIDIETRPDQREITVVGFSFDSDESLTLPFDEFYDEIKQLCESSCQKILQNGHYDTFYLAEEGITVVNWIWDDLSLSHARDAGMPHDLATQASLYTRQPYWKKSQKDEDSPTADREPFDRHCIYNGIDCCTERELRDAHLPHVDLAFYLRHYTAMFAPLLSLMRHGVKVDLDRATEMRRSLLQDCAVIQGKLANIAGANDCVCGHHINVHIETAAPLALTKAGKPRKRQPKPTYPCKKCSCLHFTPLGQPLHADVDLSSTRVVKFLYEHLGFPKLRNRGEEAPTGNEIAVRRCVLRAAKWQAERHPRVPKDAALWKRDSALAIEACQLILEHREKFKTSGFLDEAKIDEDGRFRSQYKFTTTTGRLASRKNPYGTGGNAQNIHLDVRDCFIPDEGCVFLEPDLSQAEKRVVDVLTGDPVLIANAQSKPWEFDAHTHNAAIIFAIPVDQVTKEQRYLGKRAVHASNYGMHGKRLSEALLVDGIARTADECQRMIDAYLHACSAISLWQREVRKTIMRTGQLTNSWGRTLSFKGERMNDDTYRAGYAFVPQSEVGDLLNQWGLVPLWNWLRTERMRSRINAQIHDALLISAQPDEAYDIACFVAEHLEQPRTLNGIALSIPVEFALSMTWKKDREFKRLPDRQTFNAIVRELMNGRGRRAA